MTVESTTRKQNFAGGQSALAFTFRALTSAPSDIKVDVTAGGSSSTLTYTSDYTVTIATDGVGGTVHVAPSYSTAFTYTVYRETTNKQETDYDDYNQFPADTLEGDLDRRTLIAQELDEYLGRALTLPVSTTLSSVTIQEPSAGKALVWSGTTIINSTYNADSIATIAIAAATAATTSASNAASSETNAGNYATTASTQATLAGNYATTASTAAYNVLTTSTNLLSTASTLLTTASNYISTMSTLVTSATTQATLAGNYATSASTSAVLSGNYATSSSTSATLAGNYATSASTSAVLAGNYATSSSTSATTASNYATSASTSATLAGNYATTASTAAATIPIPSGSTTGLFIAVNGAETAYEFVAAPTVGTTTLQAAYDGGKTITISTAAIQVSNATTLSSLVINHAGSTGRALDITTDSNIYGISLNHTGTLAAGGYSALSAQVTNTNTAAGASAISAIVASTASTVTGILIGQSGTGSHLRLTGDPTVASPVDGDLWYTGSALNFYDGSTTTDLLSGGGKIVQQVNTQVATTASTAAAIPIDNTIPQQSEGLEIMSLAITPTDASNILVIDVLVFWTTTANATTPFPIFKNATANAIFTAAHSPNAGGSIITCTRFRYQEVAGTTGTTTFKVRTGNAGTVYFNTNAGTALFGGTMKSSITITEVAV